MTNPIEEYTLDQIPEGEHLREWEKHDWTRQEELFAREFLRTGNRAKAFSVAWPDSKLTSQAVYTKSRKLLFQPWMQDYLNFSHDRQRELMGRSAEDILDGLVALANSNMSDFTTTDAEGNMQFDLSGITRHQAAAIQELQIETYMTGRGEDTREVKSVKMKLAPKTSAFELLGKNRKLFTDVLAHENAGDEIEELRRARERARKKREDRDADHEIEADQRDDD